MRRLRIHSAVARPPPNSRQDTTNGGSRHLGPARRRKTVSSRRVGGFAKRKERATPGALRALARSAPQTSLATPSTLVESLDAEEAAVEDQASVGSQELDVLKTAQVLIDLIAGQRHARDADHAVFAE